MKLRHTCIFFLICLGILMATIPGVNLHAVEPARKFLEALHERGYYDTAADYLDRAEANPLVSAEFKETLLYDRATTMIQGASSQRSPVAREAYLDQARTLLEEFIQQKPQHFLVSVAKGQLGNLLEKRGTLKVAESKKPGASNVADLLAQARDLYTQAYQVFETSELEVKEKLESFPTIIDERDDPEKFAQREQLRKEYLQSQLLRAVVKEELADTYEPGSEDHSKVLTEAVAQYGEIHKKRRRLLAGLYALMYQGRSFQKMNKCEDAITRYNELLENSGNQPAFRVLRLKVMLLALDAWTHESMKQYAIAAQRGREMVNGARPNEARDPDWLLLRFKVAQAFQQHAVALREANPRDSAAKSSLNEAKKMAIYVSRQPGDLQQAARALAAELGGRSLEDEKTVPRNFVEAKAAGKDALDALQTADIVLSMVPDRLAKEQDPEQKKFLQEQLEEANQTKAAGQQDAIHYFRIAMSFADAETSVEEVNIVRYFLCYLHWKTEAYLESALMGEFIAKRYPGSPTAKDCAKIAMASYLRLYTAGTEEDREFETQHVIGICDYITKQWPAEPEAAEAFNTLIPFMIKTGKLDQARAYLAGIPDNSPNKGEAAVKTGQAMWSAYLKGARELRVWRQEGEVPAAQITSKQQELDQLKQKTQEVLSDGIARVQDAGKVDASLAAASLALTQIYLDTQQTAKAIELLEHDQIGTLKLVRTKHAAVSAPDFAQETYKTALRAYIANLAGGGNGQIMITKAKEVMNELKATVGTTGAGKKRLIGIYVALARDLKQQIELVVDTQAKSALTKGFEQFLQEVSSESKELNVLNWVADTFNGMGEALTFSKTISPEASHYFNEAISTYERIIEMAKNGQLQLDDGIKVHVQLRLALLLRKLRNYEKSMKFYEAMLRKNQMVLPIQVGAAQTLQEWGDSSPKEFAKYDKAIKGDLPDSKTKRPLIWGWITLSKKIASRSDLRDTFHEARFNVAHCHLQMARGKKEGSKAAKQYYRFAQNDIRNTYRLYAKPGDEIWTKWREKYDNLMKQIQRDQKRQPIGMKEIEEEKKEKKTVASK